MRNRGIALLLSMALMSLAAGQSARADFALVFGQSNYNVIEGTTVDIDVFLVEDSPGTILFDEGLLSAYIRVYFNEEPRATEPAQVVAQSTNPGFDIVDEFPVVPATPTTTGEAGFLADALLLPPVRSTPAAPERLYLGTFRFLVGNIVDEVTHIRVDVADRDPSFVNFTTGTGMAITNSMIRAGVGSLTVIPIPEPSALALTGLGTMILGLGARRRARSSR